jgi:competence protein ComEA
MQKIKDFIYYNRKEIIISLVFILFFISYIFVTNNEIDDYKENIEIVKEEPKEEVINNEIVVDIKGEVNKPGTYKIESDKRIVDLITLAGGLTSSADTNDINLSEKLSDEMLIIIPSLNGVNKEDNNQVITKPVVKEKDNKVSINNGSLEDLMSIKGIGESKARSIIEYREKNGKFTSIEDITKVSGIGQTTFEKIKDYIKV